MICYWLLSDPSCSLKWFCNSCDKGSTSSHRETAANDAGIDSLLALVEKLLEKLASVEEMLSDKC